MVAAVASVLFGNLVTAMSRVGLGFDLGFLDTTAGFDIAGAPFPYEPSDSYGQAFLAGLFNTLLVSFLGIVFATALGLIVGVARLSGNWLVSRMAAGYVETIRNTPLLVQLFFIYFAVLLQLPTVADSMSLGGSVFLNQRGLFLPSPQPSPTILPWLLLLAAGVVAGFGLRALAARREAAGLRTHRLGSIGSLAALIVIPAIGWVVSSPAPISLAPPTRQGFNFAGGIALSPEFTAIVVGLVLYTAAFIAEVVRGGIQAIRRGQVDAAYALGLTEMQTLRLVILPQALRVIIPPLTSQYLNLAKNSSLAIAVGYPDLFKVGTTIGNQTGQPVSVIILVMATYLMISLSISLLLNLYNRRIQVIER